MSRLSRLLSPRAALRLQLTMVVVFVAVALVLAMLVIEVIDDNVHKSARMSRTALFTSQGEVVVDDMLEILDQGRHEYVASDDFLSLDAATQDVVLSELYRSDAGPADPALPAVEIPLVLKQAANLQRLFDEMLDKAQGELAADSSEITLRIGSETASAAGAVDAYLKQPTVANFRVLRASLLTLRTEVAGAIPGLAALSEDRFDKLSQATDLMRIALPVGLFLLGANGFLVVLIMGRRLQAALLAAESEKEALALRNSQLAALYNAFSEITNTLSLRYVVSAAVREALRLIRADIAVLRLVRGNELVVAGNLTSEGLEIPDMAPVPLDEGLAGRTARRGRTQRVGQGAQELLGPSADPEKHVESGIICPLIVGARIVGTLSCWSETPDAFSAEDERILEMMASQVATAVVAADSAEASERRAHHDPLTGLANRLQLTEDIEGPLGRLAAEDGRRAAVVMLDIDRFKSFNDDYGHRVGDVALQLMATVLSHALRSTDRVYRYGGEEFVLVFEDADRELAMTLAERVRTAVEATPLTGDALEPVGPLTVSMGVALLPDHASDFATLIEMADAAMYRAKEAGRNRTVLWAPAEPGHRAA